MKRQPLLVFCGPMSGRLTGQSHATLMLNEYVRTHRACVASYDTAGKPFKKALQHLRATWKIISARPESVYISLNANMGMALSVLLAASARVSGARLTIHHHTRSHLVRDSHLFNLLMRAAGDDVLHIVQCETMAKMISPRLAGSSRAAPLSNACLVEPALWDTPTVTTRKARLSQLTMGHLSNLTREKGLHLAIDCLRQAIKSGVECKLIVAGPTSNEYSTLLIESAKKEFGQLFEWRGAVYGKDKVKFFSDIDVFLFPSLYNNETQGIVNLESLASGVPVIAFDICCIGENIQNSGSASVPPSGDFVSAAMSHIAQLPTNSATLARGRFAELRREANAQLETIQNLL